MCVCVYVCVCVCTQYNICDIIYCFAKAIISSFSVGIMSDLFV